MSNEVVDRALLAIKRLRRLASWYDDFGGNVGRPTEHEVVAHMIIPLLLALGWSEQLLAIEWRHMDLVTFAKTPTNEQSCVLVCEAKGVGVGLQGVEQQAINYVKNNNLTACQKILVTDGKLLFLYQQEESGWGTSPVGYLNINNICTNYLVPANTNAVDTIVALTPARITQRI